MDNIDFELPQPRQSLLLVSGPAGSGKTTLCQRLLSEMSHKVKRVVTATTRPTRPGEEEGKDYYFLSKSEFLKKVKDDAFYEYAEVHGNLYGTLRQEIETQFALGFDLLINIDIQGARSIMDVQSRDPLIRDRVNTLFIAPKNLQVIRERMHARGQDDPDTIERRLRTALEEMKHISFYQYCLITGNREEDYEKFKAIYLTEKMRIHA